DAAAGRERGTDDHRVVGDDNGRAVADLADWSSLVVIVQFLEEIHDAVRSESGNRNAGLRIERDDLEARRREQYPLIAAAVGPVRDAAMDLSWRFIESLAFIRAVDPKRLAGGGIGGNDEAALIHREIKNAVHHDRRRLAAGLGIRNKAIRLPNPRDS